MAAILLTQARERVGGTSPSTSLEDKMILADFLLPGDWLQFADEPPDQLKGL